ncbi:MAG: hypothetical protein LUQ32_07920, partial [Methanomicrobiales archaeon]|nr:hypothetical protein [Methanomicrobiales archaeon]
MHKTIRQMILGFGTFGTGTALLYLDVNPYLLILTDTVVGVGMLFAAGSLTVEDLHLSRKGTRGEDAKLDEIRTPVTGRAKESRGLRASLGKLGGSLRPSAGRLGKGKEEKEARTKEIDRMLDAAVVGQPNRLISLAEGRGTATGPAATATGTMQRETDLLEDFSAAGIKTAFPDDEGTEEGETTPPQGTPRREASPAGGSPPVPLLETEEGKEEAQVDLLTIADEELGADDLLSALRIEAMREKKRDDSSLLRDLKGVKVT